jgi:hypothetical protein
VTDNAAEKREHPRLSLHLNLAFNAPTTGGVGECRGETVNVSAGGACFDTAEWHDLKVADRLSLRISGFSRYGTGSLFRELRGSATIVRIDPAMSDGNAVGKARVALRFEETPRFEVYDWVD